MLRLMGDLLKLIWCIVIGLFRSRAVREAEILTLRHQLDVLQRKAPKRVVFSTFDRFVFASLYRIAPDILNALVSVKPETVIRWHRAGFRLLWRWKSRSRVGRPKVPLEIRQLIRNMSLANPLWGAPRIYGELLKLGINVGQTSVAKYMARHRRPPLQGWKTFLRNHAEGIAAMDLFVVPTIQFRMLYGLVILNHGRRQILWLGVTAHPTAEWIARQLTEACGWDGTPEYIVRGRGPVYIEARGHAKSRDICSVSLGLAVAWREYPVMSLQAASVEEDRWPPVEVLIWIATRSRRFMDALKGLPLSSVEDRLWRLQRESHSPHPLSLSGALLALREEANADTFGGSIRHSHAKATARSACATYMTSLAWIFRFGRRMCFAPGPVGPRLWPGTRQRRAHGRRQQGFPKGGPETFRGVTICPLPR
jgi:hypothetical protein